MRHVVRMVVTIRFALSTRRDLLLEILALRHQLHVLVRSNRRFRPSEAERQSGDFRPDVLAMYDGDARFELEPEIIAAVPAHLPGPLPRSRKDWVGQLHKDMGVR